MIKKRKTKPKKKKIIRITPKKKGYVLRAGNYQTGSSVTSKDQTKLALKPGFRMSRNGHKYYEYRKNRSDLKNNI